MVYPLFYVLNYSQFHAGYMLSQGFYLILGNRGGTLFISGPLYWVSIFSAVSGRKGNSAVPIFLISSTQGISASPKAAPSKVHGFTSSICLSVSAIHPQIIFIASSNRNSSNCPPISLANFSTN